MQEDRWSAARAARERLERWLAGAEGAGGTGGTGTTDGTASLDALGDVAVLRHALDLAELAAVRAARAAGRSWAEIATMLGITRQSAWEKWRDLDGEDAPPPARKMRGQVQDVIGRAVHGQVEEMIGRAAGMARRRGTVSVPNVVGMRWEQARSVLRGYELVASGADPDGPADAVVVEQSPESGARVPAGSTVRLWLERGGGGGVREPRRPNPVPRAGRAMREDPGDEPLRTLVRPTDPAG